MIQFFRKISRGLAFNNDSRKCAQYAAGADHLIMMVVLIGLFLTIPSCASLMKEKQSTDVGCVVYVKNPDGSGNLLANWAYTANDTKTRVGTGYTTRSPNNQDFVGEYKIHYKGASTDSFTLVINQDSSSINALPFYKVAWLDLQTGAVVYYGTGILKDNQLIVGWRK